MRGLIAAGLCLIAAGAAAQQAETVTVNGDALVGVWKFSVPAFGDLKLNGWTGGGQASDQFCRIEKIRNSFAIRCFGMGSPKGDVDGDVRLDGGHIHINWGTMLNHATIDGTMQSNDQFAGTFIVGVGGILGGRIPGNLTGTKLALLQASPDAGGKSAVLRTFLEEIGSGQIDAPHDDQAIQQNGGQPENEGARLTQAQTSLLGKVVSVIYLGVARHSRLRAAIIPDFFTVYDVEFANGHRLCGLHQRDDGVLDGFRCV